MCALRVPTDIWPIDVWAHIGYWCGYRTLLILLSVHPVFAALRQHASCRGQVEIAQRICLRRRLGRGARLWRHEPYGLVWTMTSSPRLLSESHYWAEREGAKWAWWEKGTANPYPQLKIFNKIGNFELELFRPIRVEWVPANKVMCHSFASSKKFKKRIRKMLKVYQTKWNYDEVYGWFCDLIQLLGGIPTPQATVDQLVDQAAAIMAPLFHCDRPTFGWRADTPIEEK